MGKLGPSGASGQREGTSCDGSPSRAHRRSRAHRSFMFGEFSASAKWSLDWSVIVSVLSSLWHTLSNRYRLSAACNSARS